jgi:hypothetical protein
MYAITKTPIDFASGGGSAPFDPDTTPTILQNLGSPLTYRESLLSGLPVLESSVGASAAVPRGQRCYLADGVNDTIVWTAANTGTQYVTYYNPATASWVAPVALTHNGSAYVFAPGNIRFFNLKRWSIINPTDAQIRATTLAAAQGSGGLVSWHWCQEESGTVARDVANATPRNGTLTNVDTASFHSTHAGVDFSGPNDYGYTLSGSVVIPRNEADISQDAAGGALQFAGPVKLPGVMEVPCVMGDGTNAYVDAGAAYIPTTADFVITCKYQHVDASAFRTVIAQGNESFALLTSISGNMQLFAAGAYRGSELAISAGWHDIEITRVGNLFTLSLDGATTSATVAAAIAAETTKLLRRWDSAWFSNGSIVDFRITTGGVTTTFPLQEGPGSSNTNRNIHFVKSDGTGGVVTNAIVNGTVSNIWANRTNAVRDHCIENGGGIAANGAFVPGIPGSANDAAGNAKTLEAGKHGNPYSRLLQNHFSAPSLVNIGSTSADKYAPGYDVQAETTADTRARRTAASGDDRYLAFREALTGSELSNVEEWTQ